MILPKVRRFLLYVASLLPRDDVIEVMGITNRVKVGGKRFKEKFVAFADYDDKPLEEVVRIWRKLSRKYDLGYTYIVDSKGDGRHFQVYNPVVLSPYEMFGVLWDCDCDPTYQQTFFKVCERTLRISAKNDGRKYPEPVLIKVLKHKTKRIYSKGHLLFLQKYFSAPLPKRFKYINSNIEIVKYYTKNFGDNYGKG